MPRPTTSVRRSEGSRAGVVRLTAVIGLAGVIDTEGVIGADEKGGRDIFGASLGGAGLKGGTPSSLSAGGWTVALGETGGSRFGPSFSWSSGMSWSPSRSGAPNAE